MPSWTSAEALVSLRTRLGDGEADKYVHQIDVDPTPDGTHETFAVPNSLLVADTLRVFLDGVEIGATSPSSITADEAAGTFTLDNAPDEGAKLFASYYFQWFTDTQLAEFLQQAVQMLGFTDILDTTITLALRTPVVTLACYFAYLKKAAESAPALSASAAGFTSDNSREHPYWMDLAKQTWEMFQKEYEIATTPTVGINRPAMSFVTFRLPRYVPRT